MQNQSWIKYFFYSAFAVIGFISSFNYIVNPYNVFGHTLDYPFSLKRDWLSDRMSKTYIATRLHPQTIMIGTSRIGLFSEAALAPYLQGPVYNLSLAGSTIDEQAAYIDYMITHHKIKNVVWSLDFFSFNPTKPNDPTFDPNRLTDPVHWDDYAISLFSFKTFYRSLKTIRHNFSPDVTEAPLSGQPYSKKEVDYNIGYTLRQYATEKSFLKSDTFHNPRSIDKKLALVHQIIEQCKTHHVQCILYTSPVYYQHIDMLYSVGLGNTFEYWKKSLAYIHPYTDFCTYNSVTTNKMNFRDSSHIISDFGEVIFGRLFQNTAITIPNDFGIHLTAAVINLHLNDQNAIRLKTVPKIRNK